MNIVEIIKATVGPMVVIFTFWLAHAIVKGEVMERNSFGLNGVIAVISALGTAYAMWAYGHKANGNGGQK